MAKQEKERLDIREFVGRALVSNHLEEPRVGLGLVHVVGALAFAPNLGSAAWRLKFANDPRSYDDMFRKLLHRAARELHLPRRRRRLQLACQQAIKEWIMNACAHCGGTGIRWKKALQVVCDVCAGEGARGWTDAKRAEGLKMDETEFVEGPWAERLATINGLIRSIDLQTADAVHQALGHYGGRRAA